MKHGSLFSGIGGFDLASEWMGWENVFHCEWNKFGQQILKYYWPNSISYDDITKTDFTIHRGTIDILTGGFPCQPYSVAGKRKGKEDERHLWPEMLRAIREIQPSYVVGENVGGLVNWNGGMVFDEVQTDLEAEGFEVIPFILPACAINAPHRRDRVWFIAYANNSGANKRSGIDRKFTQENKGWQEQSQPKFRESCWNVTDTNGKRHTTSTGIENNKEEREICEEKQNIRNGVWTEVNGYSGIITNTESWRNRGIRNESETAGAQQGDKPFGGIYRFCNTPNTNDKRLQRGEKFGVVGESWENRNEQPTGCIPSNWQNFPTESPICGRNDGLPSQLDGITFSKWRNESIKGFGNAIVAPLAFEIFKVIDQMEEVKW